MGKWIVVYESKFPREGELRCKCDKCDYVKYGLYRDLRWGKNHCYYDMPKYCENCGDKKENTYIRAREDW